MKFLKYILYGIGIIFILSIIVKAFQKSVQSTIKLSGYDKTAKSIDIELLSNGENSQKFKVYFSQLTKTSLQLNDYRLLVGSLLSKDNNDGLMVLNLFDDKNNTIAVKWFDFKKPETFTIYSEKIS